MPQKPILLQFLQRGRLQVCLKRLNRPLTYRSFSNRAIPSLYSLDVWCKKSEHNEDNGYDMRISPFLGAYNCFDSHSEIKALPEYKKALLLSEVSGKVVRPAIEQAYFSANINLIACYKANIKQNENIEHEVYS